MSYLLEPGLPPSKIVYVDSADATSYPYSDEHGQGLTSTFQYDFESQLVVDQHVLSLVSVNGMSLPYSFYNIRGGVNNSLEYTLSTVDGVTSYDVRVLIPEGNYTASSIGAVLSTLMSQANRDAGPEFLNTDVSVTYYSVSQKLLWGFAIDSQRNVKIRFRLSNDSLYPENIMLQELGLLATDTQYFQIDTTGAISSNYESGLTNTNNFPQRNKFMMSPNCIDMLAASHEVFIRSSLTSSSTLTSNLGGFSSILCKAPVNVNPGGVIFLTAQDGVHKTLMRMPVLKSVTFSVTDNKSRRLNLHGLQWQIAVQIDYLYDRSYKRALSIEDMRRYRSVEHRDEEQAKDAEVRQAVIVAKHSNKIKTNTKPRRKDNRDKA